MIDQLKITGKIVGGAKQGAFFTQLDWVREQCLKKLGFTPWPGTLNLEISAEGMPVVKLLKPEEGIELVPPDSQYCSGHVYPVSVEGIRGAIVFPAEDVRVHKQNIVEIISPKMLKDALKVKDGDWVTLTINAPELVRKPHQKLEVNAVLFDLDGTLIDSAPLYYQIIDIVFERLGVPPASRETLQDAMDDGVFDWDFVLPAAMKSRKEALVVEARVIIDDIAPPLFRRRLKLIPGAVDLCEKIAACGLKIGLVTSTPRDYIAVKLAPLRKAGIEKLLQVIVTADDVINKKPHAEPLIKGSQELGVAAEQCVYVGDTRVDIRAGNAAGMKTVGVLTGFDDFDALKKERPDAIINSIAQLDESIVIC
ncbi:MAG: HAD-IA family hydrolase [Desulfobacterales bacterium]